MIASNAMLESRLKIWFGVEKELSSQFSLQCNFMTEGCHGGWGIFTGFFLENFYAVDASCAPYQAKTAENGCSAFSQCAPVAKVGHTYYVSDHYGGMSEETIMKELRANGPLLYDFMADHVFQVYGKGVLT